MKFNDVLKDPAMKYPWSANRLLDAGMILVLLGAVGLLVAVFFGLKLFAILGTVSFAGGSLTYVAARLIARIKRSPDEPKSSHLRLVK